MKFKKLVVALSAVAMLGSLVVAVPASAVEENVTLANPYKGGEKVIGAAGGTSAVYPIGKVTEGDVVDVTVNLNMSNTDLTVLGVYIYNGEEGTPSYEVLKTTGKAIAAEGHLKSSANQIEGYPKTVNFSTDEILTKQDTMTTAKGLMATTSGTMYLTLVVTKDNTRYCTINNITVTKPFASLEEACGAAESNATITLLNNIETSRIIPAKNVTIDLNQKTITGIGSDKVSSVFELNTGANGITFKNGTIERGTKTVSIEQKNGATTVNLENLTTDIVKTNKNLTLKNSTITTINTGSISGSDAPKITAEGSTTVKEINVTGSINPDTKLPYTLYSGFTPDTVTVPDGYTCKDGIITKAEETKTLSYAFTKTIADLEDTVTVTVATNEGTAKSTFNKMTVTGEGALMLGIILDVPSDITVNSVTIE